MCNTILGYRRENNFEVTKVTTPSPEDIQNRTYCERNDCNHLLIFSKLSKNTNRAISFLGEWHTHLDRNPIPSSIDLKEWQKKKENNTAPLIFCILGIENIYFHIEP